MCCMPSTLLEGSIEQLEIPPKELSDTKIILHYAGKAGTDHVIVNVGQANYLLQ